ncbi:hypothetical protein DRO97_02910 [Archaeoglobales archaeon]|nr:MAG: hypothetical protein DRO97_02910 [Archaeoglobales archaeon]
MIKKRTFLVFFYFLIILSIYSEIFIILKYYYENERYTFLDGIYWVITTITTVGYGDVVFYTHIGKIFTIVVMLTGILFIFGFIFPYVIMPWAEMKLKLSLPKSIEGLRNHVMVCGYNKMSSELCNQLYNHGIFYVLMDDSEENVRRALESNLKCVLSDMSLESFKKNGVKDAVAVVIMWYDVEKVIDTLLTLSDFNIKKYVVFGDPFYVRYFHYAGASKVFTPKGIIAANIANMMLEHMKRELKVKKILSNLGSAEILVGKGSIIIGRRLEEVEREFNVEIIAVCKGGEFAFNPRKDEVIWKGTIMLVVGEEKDITSLFHVAW